MSEPTAHIDTYILDNLPPKELWPEMDYSVLPELAAYPARLNAAAEILDKRAAGEFADKPAVLFEDQVWSYAELQARANKIAHVLVDDLGF